ncbi:hypothetical protein JCM10207_007039 [Rhodosporidiobolus poonsookiae]
MRLYQLLGAAIGLAISAPTTSAIPAPLSPSKEPEVQPVPVVIWHGLGDRFDAPGLAELKSDLESRPNLEGVFVHIVQLGDDGAADQRATFFGSAVSQIDEVCEQLNALPELVSPKLNPSGVFDAIGFSQGGQLLRGVVEKCTEASSKLRVRNLITVGSQHMGISAFPPCPPDSPPFSACRLMHLGLVREGVYSSWAQHQIVSAQYFRDEARIDDYLRVNTFLKDINNEREGDDQVGAPSGERGDAMDEPEPRKKDYKENLARLNRLVMLRFSEDVTVVPAHSSHFTLPSPNATNCPTPPSPADPFCYSTPVAWKDLPLYREDYVGLKRLDEAGRIVKGVCEGAHMQISAECWEGVVRWLGKRGEKGPVSDGIGSGGGEQRGDEVWYTSAAGAGKGELVFQL